MKAKTLGLTVGVLIVIFFGLGAVGVFYLLNPTQATQTSSPSSTSTTIQSTTTPQTQSTATLSTVRSATASSAVTSTSTTTSKTQSSTTSSAVTSTATSASGVTLQDIISGKFPTAKDKQGTGGITVTVYHLFVLYVRSESDGDWHVAVTDGKVTVFITEITPSFQSFLGKPAIGSTIDERGTPYCDTIHQTESWHGNTCWEIHPVTSWQLSSRSPITTTTTQIAPSSLNVTISYARNPISRGSTQTITVQVTDSDGPVSNAIVSVNVVYASGQTTKDFTCTTLADGSCAVSWTIGGNSTPGTFAVKVVVEGISFYSSFVVTTA